MQIINARTKDLIASDVEVADTRRARRRGLLGRDHLDPSGGLILSPCFMIHTAFMRFPIDVVFVDRYGFVLKAVWGLAPWRIAVVPGARFVVELAAGVLRRHEVRPGDRLDLVSRTAASAAA